MRNYTICAYMRLSKEDSDVFGRKIESGSISSQRSITFVDVAVVDLIAGMELISIVPEDIS